MSGHEQQPTPPDAQPAERSAAATGAVAEAPRARICPYCGRETDGPSKCGNCGGLFEPLSKQATQNAMGPWQVRDEDQPHMPACSFETLRSLVARGKVTPDSVVRGPTTHQFWARARHTPGLATIFGLCHACEASVTPSDAVCTECGATLAPRHDRDHLGLIERRDVPGMNKPEPARPAAKQAAGQPSAAQTPPAEERASLKRARARIASLERQRTIIITACVLAVAAAAALAVQLAGG